MQDASVGLTRARQAGTVIADIADGAVQAIRSVVNPDKLGHLGPVSDVARLPERE